jgi:DNA-binding transcriptional LysR family regulator
MFDWDDLRIFLAAARGGSFSAAAARLGIDPATVGRRVARLETAMKATLLARGPGGLHLTAAGARVLAEAERAEAAMEAVGDAGQPELVGTVRISASEGFGAAILAPALPRLRRLRPGLRIEMAAAPGFLSPSRHEVELVVTLSPLRSSRLHVEPLTDYELGLYVSPALRLAADMPKTVEDLQRMEMVGYVDDLIYAPELRYLDELLPGLTPSIASSSIQAQRAVIAAGGGVGVLPCFLAQGLVRILPEVRLIRRFWIATRVEVKDTARIRTVRAWLQDLVSTHLQDLLPSQDHG